MVIELVVAALVLLGAGFALLGSIALVRLPDFFTRLHGPTKATTLGVGAMLAGSALYLGSGGDAEGGPRELLILLFLVMTAPVSGQLLARAALFLGVRNLATRAREPATADADDAPAERH
jgi:multicomponent K+:H+ antiporter subunit G